MSQARVPADRPHAKGASVRSKSRPAQQASLAGLRSTGIVPRRSLGQNFLVDDNIVRVILSRLEATSEDVVLEVGAGFGVLTQALLTACQCVHAFEIDKKIAAALEERLSKEAAPADRLRLYVQDVLEAPLEELAPPPTLCASNLPYSIAASFMAEAVGRLPHVRRYVVMVQKEVAERMTASPGSSMYGALSVWMRLHTRLREARPLARTVFRPVPRVDSTLLTLDRAVADAFVWEQPELVRAVIAGAFSQRRKTWVNGFSAFWGLAKEDVMEAGAAAGIAAGRRAETLEPLEFVALAREVAARGWRPPGRAGASPAPLKTGHGHRAEGEQ